MLLNLSKDVVEDCKLLADVSAEALSSLCSLAMEHITQGSSPQSEKLIRKAAKSLGVEASALTSAIHALSFVLLDASRRHLTTDEFTASLPPLSFPASHTSTLASVYASHARSLQSVLTSSSLSLPAYRDLDWRLDVVLHTRAMTGQAAPVYVLQWTVQREGKDEQVLMQADHAALLALERELEDAVKGLHSKEATRIRRYVK